MMVQENGSNIQLLMERKHRRKSNVHKTFFSKDGLSRKGGAHKEKQYKRKNKQKGKYWEDEY